MAGKVVVDSKLLNVFQENSKVIERLSWKNLDTQQFAQAQLPLLKGLAQASVSLPKSLLRTSIQHAKLTLSPSECELLLEKIKNTFQWCRKRLRDAGSGVHLPMEVRAVGRLWSKGKLGSKKKSQKAPKKKALSVEKKDLKEKAISVENEDPKTKANYDIRSVFGLPGKAVDVVAIPSESDTESGLPSPLESSVESSSSVGFVESKDVLPVSVGSPALVPTSVGSSDGLPTSVSSAELASSVGKSVGSATTVGVPTSSAAQSSSVKSSGALPSSASTFKLAVDPGSGVWT